MTDRVSSTLRFSTVPPAERKTGLPSSTLSSFEPVTVTVRRPLSLTLLPSRSVAIMGLLLASELTATV